MHHEAVRVDCLRFNFVKVLSVLSWLKRHLSITGCVCDLIVCLHSLLGLFLHLAKLLKVLLPLILDLALSWFLTSVRVVRHRLVDHKILLPMSSVKRMF